MPTQAEKEGSRTPWGERPKEPPPAPRPVRPGALRTWDMGFGFVWGAGYGGIPAVVLVVLALTMGSPFDDLALDRRGQRAMATVTSVGGTGTELNDEPLLRVSLRYRDGNDREQTTSFTTTSPPAVGESVELDYDPTAPSVSRRHGGHASLLTDQPWIPLMLIGVFIVPGGLAFLWSSWRYGQRRRLYIHGATAEARVVSLTPSGSEENDVPVLVAHYQFRVNGQLVEGEHKATSLPQVNDTLWIIYDPADPRRNMVG